MYKNKTLFQDFTKKLVHMEKGNRHKLNHYFRWRSTCQWRSQAPSMIKLIEEFLIVALNESVLFFSTNLTNTTLFLKYKPFLIITQFGFFTTCTQIFFLLKYFLDQFVACCGIGFLLHYFIQAPNAKSL